MSQDNVNRLPIEILCNIFDLLSYKDQQTAVLTCVRWSKIFTSERYLMQRRVKIDLDMIDDSSNTEALLRYRAFSVKDKNALVDDLKMMREFLKEQVAGHVEDLKLDLSRFTWAELFAPQDVLYFSKLRKFSYSSTFMQPVIDQVHKRLVAPKLTKMFLQTVDESIIQLVQLYSDQLELLDAKYIDKKYFPAILGNCTFVNLRSLTISCLIQHLYESDTVEFNSTQKDMLARLTSLELNHWNMVSYTSILQAASNLETLTITGRSLNENQFIQIAKMTRLKELHLMTNFGNWFDTGEKLSLPHLKKLTTFSGALVPLGNVPRLRHIAIGNHWSLDKGQRLNKKQIESFFKECNQLVETLTFSNMFVKTSFVDQICTMSNLRSLELHSIKMKSDDIRRVFQSLNRRGQRIHCECCVFAHKIAPRYKENMVEQYRSAASLKPAEVFFRELISQYPDHRISQRLCRKVDLIEKVDHWKNFETEFLDQHSPDSDSE